MIYALYESSGLRTFWQKCAILMLQNVRICLSKRDQVCSISWLQLNFNPPLILITLLTIGLDLGLG